MQVFITLADFDILGGAFEQDKNKGGAEGFSRGLGHKKIEYAPAVR